MTLDEKLDLILSILQNPVQVSGVVAVEDKAYNKPPLTVGEVVIDGQTVNKDGSIWAPVASFGGGEHYAAVYGYISPVKTPKIWEAAKRLLGDSDYQGWNKRWQENPYGIYTVSPVQAENEALNFMMFNFFWGQPTRTVIQ